MKNWIQSITPKLDINDFVGFVYIIENIYTGKFYIGQKVFWENRKLKPLKGKTRFRHKKVESNWKTYWGSSEELLKDIEEREYREFTRSMIHLCKSKSEMNYIETKEQFKYNVLKDPKSYNKIINCRISANQVKNVDLL